MLKMFRRFVVFSFALGLLGCGETDTTTPSDTQDESANTPACQLLEDFGDCGACYDGIVTCSYGDISVTEGSCQGCQALVQVYIQLCNNGNTDSAEAIEAGTECTDPVQE